MQCHNKHFAIDFPEVFVHALCLFIRCTTIKRKVAGESYVGCWDHVRRKSVEASKAALQKKKGHRVSKADVATGKIRKLYRIEKQIQDLDAEDKTQQRQTLALLQGLKSWLETNSRRVPKDSLTCKATRPFAVGRRNWLFADTPRGAKASATVYSLIETAKANKLEPFAYIRHVLRHIAEADTAEKLDALLPWNVSQGIFQGG